MLYGHAIELVNDGDGVYLVKQIDEVEQEAESIIEGIWQERGDKCSDRLWKNRREQLYH